MSRLRAFLAELKRRRVWRVAIVYATTAFVVVQVADLFFPRLALPAWTVTLVVVLSLLGFPIALVLAWAFELSPEGVRRTQPAAPGEAPVGPARRRLGTVGYAAAGVLAVVLGYLLFARGDGSRPPDASFPTLAVLPLTNLSGEAESEYFADGMTEELMAALGRVEGLRIVSRTSAFAFKGRQADVREVGEKLAASAVLEGSVRTAPERLRIAVRLVDARDGYQLWSETYDRAAADVFEVQEEISRSVVEALAARLGPGGKGPVVGEAPLVRKGTDDLEAYDLYLQGRFFVNKWDAPNVRSGIGYLERAIEMDSGFARAYAGLADAYIWLLLDASVEEALPRARAAAQRSLELDASLSEAHYAIARIASEYDWDWPRAEWGFRRAIELDPRNGEAHHRYAHLLTLLGRHEEATAESLRLLELDPLDAEWHHHLGYNYLIARRFDLAEAPYRKALELDPDVRFTREHLGVLFVKQGRFPEAIEMLRESLARRGPDAGTLTSLAWGYVMAGDTAAARGVLAEIDRQGIEVPAWRWAYVHAALGETDLAFNALERAYAERRVLSDLVRHPRIDALRKDPRFGKLLERMNLEP